MKWIKQKLKNVKPLSNFKEKKKKIRETNEKLYQSENGSKFP